MKLTSVFLIASFAAAVSDPVVTNGNGTVLGHYAGDMEPLKPSVGPDEQNYRRRMQVITSTGFRVLLDPRFGEVMHTRYVYFESPDCSGPVAYAINNYGPSDNGVEADVPVGSIFRNAFLPSQGGPFRYIPKQPTFVSSNSLAIQSLSTGLSCSASSGPSDTEMVETLENDPGVTGFDPAELVLPIEVSVLDLFRDGFESTARRSIDAYHVA